MAIHFQPSIWDQLGLGIGQGTESYVAQQQRMREEEARKRAEAMQQTQMMLGMRESGAMPTEQFNTGIAGLSKTLPMLKGMQAQGPSAAELRSKIATSPDLNIQPMGVLSGQSGVIKAPGSTRFSDTQLEFAGMKTNTQREAERLQNELGRTNLRSAKAGVTINEARAGVAGQDVQLDVSKKRTDALSALGNNYVRKAISDVGGIMNINARNSEAIANKAFQEAKATGVLEQFGSLSPSDYAYFEAQLHAGVQDAFKEAYQLQSQRISALAQRENAGRPRAGEIDTPLEIYRGLTSSEESLRKQLEGMEATAGMYAAMPEAELKDPMTKELAKRYRDVFARLNVIRSKKTVMEQEMRSGVVSPQTTAEAKAALQGDNTQAVPGSAEIPRSAESSMQQALKQLFGMPRNSREQWIDLLPINEEDKKILKAESMK